MVPDGKNPFWDMQDVRCEDDLGDVKKGASIFPSWMSPIPLGLG
jgi:hypothetical protein